MTLWEMLLAPSISQRKLFEGLGSLDRWLGGPVHKLILVWQKRWRKENVMHRIALQAPEEDEYLLLHIWSTITVWFFAGLLGEIDDWVRFDTAVPEREKRRVLRFYRECLQRHQYARDGDGRHYLAKNPNFAPKIDTLFEWFPDARFIYLARNPLDMIPSSYNIFVSKWDSRDTDRALRPVRWALLGLRVAPQGDFKM